MTPAGALVGGSWNLRVGRRPQVVAGEVHALLVDEGLDFLAVCEAHAYLKAIRRRLKGTPWRIVCYPNKNGSARDSAVIIRGPLFKRGSRRLHRLGGQGWERGKGRPGRHWPRSAVSAQVKDGPRIIAVHLPPTPRVPSLPLRRLAHDKALRALLSVFKRWKTAWVAAGDWNLKPDVSGADPTPSVAWLAQKTGATITGNGIDYVMAHGRHVTHYRRGLKMGSDHRPVMFHVTGER